MLRLSVRRVFCQKCHAYEWRVYYPWQSFNEYDIFNSWQDAMDEVNLIYKGRA